MTDNARPWRDSFGNAVRVYDRIRLDDPTGKLADDATMAAGNAKFAAGKFLDADDFYTDLRRTFPSSEHQFRAHLLGVKSKLQSYTGPSYDGKALDGAEELILQIRKQFPAEAEAEREYLAKAYAEVRFKKAEREWTLARYYEKRSEYGGARYYYNVVVNDYDDTPFADKARQRLQEIGGKPATPPQRLSWLVKIFPETDDIKPLLASGSSETKRR
jgi:outer membrane protein assembly factor BamD (BamD/ComL family)